MTSDEAKQALKEGRKVRSKEWATFISINKKIVIADQEGSILKDDIFDRFKNDEWELVE